MITQEADSESSSGPPRSNEQAAGQRDSWRGRGRALLVRHPVLSVFTAALIVRIAAAIISFVLNHRWLIPDEGQYLDLVRWVASGRSAERWFPGYGQSLYDSTRVFLSPLVFLFHFLPASRLVAQLWVALFGALTAALTTRLCLEVTRKWAVLAGLIVAFLPSQVLLSSVVLREALIWAALALMALALALSGRVGGRRLFGSLLLVAVGVLALSFLRSQTAIVAAWASAGACVVAGRHRLLRLGAALLIAAAIPYAAGLGIGGWSLVVRAIPRLGQTRAYMALDAKTAFAPGRVVASTVPSATTTPSSGGGGGAAPSSGGGGGAAGTPAAGPNLPPSETKAGSLGIASRSPTAVKDQGGHAQEIIRGSRGEAFVVDNSALASLSEAPRGLVAVLFRPFPWEHQATLSARVARIENIAWYGLYLLAAVGLALGWRDLGVTAFPVIVSIGIVGVATVTQGNLGTAFRHRGQVLWAVALLAAMGLHGLEERRRRGRGERTQPMLRSAA
ncbi:MAG: hypothetical protein ACYDAD_02575 [Acidimicrobiales bacterium]